MVVFVGQTFLSKISYQSFKEGISSFKKAVVITDKTVASLYEKTVFNTIALPLFIIPSGEWNKTRHTKEVLEDQLLQWGIDDATCLIAVGGGVVLDIAGFVAATLHRGLPWVAVPTTLLAMVDACLGGKTGVNTPRGKNLIGAFHSPQHVVVDRNFLQTLPDMERLSGLAEVIKYGLIASSALFDDLYEGFEAERDIPRCLNIKSEITAEDPWDKSCRRILNFGHTFAHAIEAASCYQIPHGIAVARGLLAESFLSIKMGFLCEKDWIKIQEIIEKTYQYPKTQIDPDKVFKALFFDKKRKDTRPRFVLLSKIGDVMDFSGQYCTEVPDDLVEEAMQWL